MALLSLWAGAIVRTRLLRTCGLLGHFHKAGAGREGALERQQLGGAVNVSRKPEVAALLSDRSAPRRKVIW